MGLEELLILQKEDINSIKYYIKPLITMLQYHRIFMPIYPLPTNAVSLITIIVAVCLTTNFLLIFSEIVAAFVDFDVQRFANGIGTLGLHVMAFFKWIFCLKNSDQIFRLISQLNKCHLLSLSIDSNKKGKEKYERIMEKTQSNARIFLYLWTWSSLWGTSHWCFNPILVRIVIKDYDSEQENSSYTGFNPLPFIGWYPWNVSTMYNYYGTYLLQATGGIATGAGLIVYDVLHITFLMFICAQLRYLNIALSDPLSLDQSAKTIRSNLSRKLKQCVAQHSEVIKFLYNLEVLVNPIMFAQCIETMIIICLLSFEVSTLKVTMDTECFLKLWSMAEYFLAVSLQLYLFCYYATTIKYLGLEVADSAYCCNWEYMILNNNFVSIQNRKYNFKSFKCSITMILIRAQKPIVLTGGPFYELSLDTYRAILGMAISNALILRQVSGVG